MGSMSGQLPDGPEEPALGSPVERLLRQAPVAPLHDDGVRVFTIGTIAFALGWVLLAVGGSAWAIDPWWREVALSGVVIGVVATAYCIWRRDKRAKDAAIGIPPPTA